MPLITAALDSMSFTLIDEETEGDACPLVITRIYQIADICGNTASCTQVLTIDDDEPPSLTCPPDMLAVCDASEVPVYADLDAFVAAGGVASDNCALDSMSFTLIDEFSDMMTCPEIVTRVYSVADECGNVMTCSHTITVDDDEAPMIICPPDFTIECEMPYRIPDPLTGLATATDNCTVEDVTFSDSELMDNMDPCNPSYLIRTWIATDACGNFSTCTQRIDILDTTPPTLTCPPDMTLEWPEDFDITPKPRDVEQDMRVAREITGFPIAR